MKKVFLALFFAWGTAFAVNIDLCMSFLSAEDYQKAIQVGKELIGKNPDSFSANLCLSSAYKSVGNFKKSLEYARALERLARDDDDLLSAYNYLGMDYQNLGDLDTAFTYYMRGLSLSRNIKNRMWEATFLNNMAIIYDDKGQYQEALELYRRSLELKNDRDPTILGNIGTVYGELGDYKSAERYLKQAMELAEKRGDFYNAVFYMLNLGATYDEMKNYKLAEKTLSEGLKMAKILRDSYLEYRAYKYYAQLYFDMGNREKSLEYRYKAYKLGKKMGYKTR